MFFWALRAARIPNFAKNILFTIRACPALPVRKMDCLRPDDNDRCFAAAAFIRYPVTRAPCIDHGSSFSINRLTHERVVAVWRCCQRNQLSARISDPV
jgi:hypothetical protein